MAGIEVKDKKEFLTMAISKWEFEPCCRPWTRRAGSPLLDANLVSLTIETAPPEAERN
jgi:hypothetical protein